MAREHYLLNQSHRNHKRTEQIINVFGSETQSLNILRNTERYKLRQASKKRGGRPPTAAVEFSLNLPKGIRPSMEEWRQVLNKLMVELAAHLGVSTRQLATIVRAVVHQQDQDTNVRGSGDHMHIVIGKFTYELQYLSDLQRKSTTRLIKIAFNNAVDDVVGISHQSYQIQKNYSGSAKKRAPSWKVKAARKQEMIKAQERHIKKMIDQANKWHEAYEVGDYRQMNRQYNRLLKGMETVDTSNDETASLYEFMQQLVCKVETKAKNGGRLLGRMPQP
ncbi:hypothetical protein F0237_07785 [Vibrio tubiashii]|uniref:Uncharacterized protein n=2 Tax=Vibrio tubiashii TaxID=29498 RepID=A0AAE5GPR4_9VIBR|nr:hypothetical protein [Vibrio tubiashii]